MKINLSNLEQATAKQVFDQVAVHLLTQNKKSMKNAGCRYRNPEGLKCAAGCLISDDEYVEDMEGSGWNFLVYDMRVAPRAHLHLISALQNLHDNENVEYWKAGLRSIAKLHGLDHSILDKVNS